jgi:exosome complex RNA-binding protein Rrp4
VALIVSHSHSIYVSTNSTIWIACQGENEEMMLDAQRLINHRHLMLLPLL